jgi:hypothetical protein
MHKSIFALSLAVAALVAAAPHDASAHERQVFTIDGKDYLFVVGSVGEPVVVDDKTGVDARVLLADPVNPGDSKAQGAKPVEGLNETLKVEISAADKKRVFDLSPAFNDPGAYRAPFFPTVQTTLTYRFFGTINGAPVDLSFVCNPAGHPRSEDDKSVVDVGSGVTRKLKAGAFGCPVAKADLGFPEPSTSLADLQKNVGGLDARLSDLAPTTRNFTLLGIGIGVLALLVAIGAWFRKRGNA